MIIGIGQRGESVIVPSVILDKLRVFVFSRILFSALKEHVLQEMGTPVVLPWIECASYMDVDCCSRHVCLHVRNEEAPHFIGELKEFVLFLVEW